MSSSSLKNKLYSPTSPVNLFPGVTPEYFLFPEKKWNDKFKISQKILNLCLNLNLGEATPQPSLSEEKDLENSKEDEKTEKSEEKKAPLVFSEESFFDLLSEENHPWDNLEDFLQSIWIFAYQKTKKNELESIVYFLDLLFFSSNEYYKKDLSFFDAKNPSLSDKRTIMRFFDFWVCFASSSLYEKAIPGPILNCLKNYFTFFENNQNLQLSQHGNASFADRLFQKFFSCPHFEGVIVKLLKTPQKIPYSDNQLHQWMSLVLLMPSFALKAHIMESLFLLGCKSNLIVSCEKDKTKKVKGIDKDNSKDNYFHYTFLEYLLYSNANFLDINTVPDINELKKNNLKMLPQNLHSDPFKSDKSVPSNMIGFERTKLDTKEKAFYLKDQINVLKKYDHSFLNHSFFKNGFCSDLILNYPYSPPLLTSTAAKCIFNPKSDLILPQESFENICLNFKRTKFIEPDLYSTDTLFLNPISLFVSNNLQSKDWDLKHQHFWDSLKQVSLSAFFILSLPSFGINPFDLLINRLRKTPNQENKDMNAFQKSTVQYFNQINFVEALDLLVYCNQFLLLNSKTAKDWKDSKCGDLSWFCQESNWSFSKKSAHLQNLEIQLNELKIKKSPEDSIEFKDLTSNLISFVLSYGYSSDFNKISPHPLESVFKLALDSEIVSETEPLSISQFSISAINNEKEWLYLTDKAIREFKETSGKMEHEMIRDWIEKVPNLPRQKPLGRVQPALDNLNHLVKEFPHFEEILGDLRDHFALSKVGGGEFSLPPLLLAGPPGTGKTFFFQKLAAFSNVDYHLLQMESVNASFAITGMESGWAGSTSGFVFEKFMSSRVANPLFLLDEIDKTMHGISNGGDIDNCLLALLEPHTAQVFTDRCVKLPLDIRKINWVATANYLQNVSAPIKSRFKIIHVPSPDKKARIAMATAIYKALRASHEWGAFFEEALSYESLDVLVDEEGSARDLRKNLTTAFAKAALANSKRILPEHVPMLKKSTQIFPWDEKLPKLHPEKSLLSGVN